MIGIMAFLVMYHFKVIPEIFLYGMCEGIRKERLYYGAFHGKNMSDADALIFEHYPSR